MATPPRTPTPARKEKDPLKMSYEERARANEQRLAEARKGTPAEQALPTYRARSGSGGQAQKTQDYTVGAENLTIEASRGGGIVTVSGGTIEQQQAVSQSIAQAQRAKQDAVKAGEQAKAYLVSQQVQEVETILKQQQALKNQSSQPKPSELPYDINKPNLSPPTASQTPFIIKPALAPATSGQETVRLPPRQVTQTPQTQGIVTEYQSQRLLGQKQTPQELRESIVQFSEAYAPKGALKNIVQNALQAGGEFLIVKPTEIVTAVATVTTRPKQTAQAIITANPVEVAKETIESFKQKTAGQQVGGVAFDIASSIALTKPIAKISETVAEAIVPTPKITQARTVSIASTIDEGKTITETTGKIQTQIGKKTQEYNIQSTQITKPDYDQTILIQEKGTIGAKGKTPSVFETVGQAKQDGNIILTKTDIKTDTTTYRTIGETTPLTDTSTQTNILIGQKTKKGSKLIGAEYQISQDVAEKQGAYNLKAQDGQVNIEYSIPAQQS